MDSMWTPPVAVLLQTEERRRIRRAANFCGGVIVAMYAMQFFVSFVLQWLVMVGVLDPQQSDYGIGLVGKEALDMFTYLLFLAVPALMVAKLTRVRISPFPTCRVRPALFVCMVLGGMAMAIFSNISTAYVMAWLENIGIYPETFSNPVDPSPLGLVLALLSTAVLPALVEEMIFRGYLLGALRPLGNGIGIVLSAVLFGLFHGNVQQVVFAFVLGVVLSFLTVQTGSIWPAVVLHFCNNAMAVVLDYATQFTTEDGASAATMITFGLVCVAGITAIGALFITHRGSTAASNALRPVYNHADGISPAARVGYVFTAPLFLVALVVMLIDIAGTVNFA